MLFFIVLAIFGQSPSDTAYVVLRNSYYSPRQYYQLQSVPVLQYPVAYPSYNWIYYPKKESENSELKRTKEHQISNYNLLKCLIEEEKKSVCKQMLDSVKQLFEPTQKPKVSNVVIKLSPSTNIKISLGQNNAKDPVQEETNVEVELPALISATGQVQDKWVNPIRIKITPLQDFTVSITQDGVKSTSTTITNVVPQHHNDQKEISSDTTAFQTQHKKIYNEETNQNITTSINNSKSNNHNYQQDTMVLENRYKEEITTLENISINATELSANISRPDTTNINLPVTKANINKENAKFSNGSEVDQITVKDKFNQTVEEKDVIAFESKPKEESYLSSTQAQDTDSANVMKMSNVEIEGDSETLSTVTQSYDKVTILQTEKENTTYSPFTSNDDFLTPTNKDEESTDSFLINKIVTQSGLPEVNKKSNIFETRTEETDQFSQSTEDTNNTVSTSSHGIAVLLNQNFSEQIVEDINTPSDVQLLSEEKTNEEQSTVTIATSSLTNDTERKSEVSLPTQAAQFLVKEAEDQSSSNPNGDYKEIATVVKITDEKEISSSSSNGTITDKKKEEQTESQQIGPIVSSNENLKELTASITTESNNNDKEVLSSTIEPFSLSGVTQSLNQESKNEENAKEIVPTGANPITHNVYVGPPTTITQPPAPENSNNQNIETNEPLPIASVTDYVRGTQTITEGI